MKPNKKENSIMEEAQVLLSLLSHTSCSGAIKPGVSGWSLGRPGSAHSPTALHRAGRCWESSLQRELEEQKAQ